MAITAINLSNLDGSNGFRLDEVVLNDGAGFSVSGAGDVNGDGFDDLLVGAPKAGQHGYNSGTSYVIFGRSGRMCFMGVPVTTISA